MRFLIAISLMLMVAGSPGGAEPARPAYLVIVHPSNRAERLSRKFVADAFFKKVTRWGNDRVIHPVDLPPGAAARRGFSAAVLKRSVKEMKSYWQQVIFSGRGVAPPELATDVEVVRYVLENPGAIGYVSGASDVGAAKVVGVD